MTQLSFLDPTMLWLLLLLPLVWLLAFVTRERPTPIKRAWWRRGLRWSLLVRTLIVVMLVFALAGAQLVRPVETLTVVFLIDGSDSVAPSQRDRALAFINEAMEHGDSSDRAAIVLFGKNALVERVPGELVELQRLTSVPIAIRTNIEEALQLGLALFPADTQKRLVLLSDGHENEGRAQTMVALAQMRNIPIDVVHLPHEQGNDALVRLLNTPGTAREGQPIPLEAYIVSDYATEGTINVFFADGDLIETREIAIERGETVVLFEAPGGDGGFRRYEVRLEAHGDTQPANNRAAAFTYVEGRPHILLIASDASRAEPLQRALESAGARVTLSAPNDAPSDQASLHSYAAVMVVDVFARDVPRALQEALPTYVREQGGSLAMIGGHESFGAGGWRRSPVAAVLPVELDPPSTQQRPDVALVLVIDRSGSMSEVVSGGRTRLDLAKEAVFHASLGLERDDQLGIVSFETFATWELPLQSLPDAVALERALSGFIADGGTDIRSGIVYAAEALAATDAKVKHVILLTDGIAPDNYRDLITQMRNDNTTISVVSIGHDADPHLMSIAELGEGRFYRVEHMNDVPTIFLNETVMVAGRDIIEATFTPLVALRSPAVRGLGELPPLSGMNVTEARSTARTLLVSPDGKPLLAQWQHGLGRSIAWTSDMTGQWANEWVTWEQFPRFVAGMLDLLLPPQRPDGLILESHVRGSDMVFDLLVQNRDGHPIDEVTMQGRLVRPDEPMSGIADQPTNQLEFHEVGAGHYRAVAPADQPGVYLAQVAVFDHEEQMLGMVRRGAIVSYSPEYSSALHDGNTLLEYLATTSGGRASIEAPMVFEPTSQVVGVVHEMSLALLWMALLLLPLDIALRRLRLRWSDIAAVGSLVRQRWNKPTSTHTAAPDATIARLQAARARARKQTDRHHTFPPTHDE